MAILAAGQPKASFERGVDELRGAAKRADCPAIVTESEIAARGPA